MNCLIDLKMEEKMETLEIVVGTVGVVVAGVLAGFFAYASYWLYVAAEAEKWVHIDRAIRADRRRKKT